MSLSLDHVSSSLQLMRRTLDRKLTQARQRLVQLAGFLPYAASINTRNVGSHARTIIKLSALVGSTEEQCGSGSAAQLPAVAAAAQRQPQQLAIEGPVAAQQQRRAPEVPAAAEVAQERQQSAAQGELPCRQQPEQQQPDGAAVGQKRALEPGEAGSLAAAPGGKHARTAGSAAQGNAVQPSAAEAPS